MLGCRAVAVAGAFAGTLLAAPDLAVQRLSLHQYEDGPILESSYEYLPGETAWFSAHITGFSTQPQDLDKRVHLSWTMEVRDPAGVLVDPPHSGDIEETLLPQDKEWVPKFLVDFMVPSFAPGGVYKIPVTVKDELSGDTVSRELEFHVRGEPLPEATSLAVRNFRFLAHENDRFGMEPAVYHPGDALFARFEIVGYSFEENNRFSVDYGMAILAGENQVFSQPGAADESKEGFYPQRWVPGAFSLNLDKNVAPGMYTLVITAHDKLSGASEESRQTFEVR